MRERIPKFNLQVACSQFKYTIYISTLLNNSVSILIKHMTSMNRPNFAIQITKDGLILPWQSNFCHDQLSLFKLLKWLNFAAVI